MYSMSEPMIDTSEIKLLIFDLDGTIHAATKPEIEAIRRAYKKLNIKFDITERAIEKYFGFPSEVFWNALAPQNTQLSWQEIRSAVCDEYAGSMRDFATLYPHVKETLEILRKRAYHLALCSNSRIAWFTSAVIALGIKEYFDYFECLEDNNLNKIQLVQKIKDKYGNPKTAVVGDRSSDIEAARENNALSVGVLYGYGGEEPKQADITINGFSDLLGVFDRRLPLFQRILDEVKKRKREDRAFVIGITGIDTSGKTKFSEALVRFIASKGYDAQLVRLDDFHNPREIRYAGNNQAENYYQRSFDITTIVQKLLLPIRTNKEFSTKLTLLNLLSNKYEVEKEYFVTKDTIVIFEGVFLFRKELSTYLGYKIFLEIDFDESKRRAKPRDVHLYGEEILERYDIKYLPAQRKYLEEYPPLQTAEMIINNHNWEYPIIQYQH
jgi:phosphoglycolate phosphatase-like HAD superfamily hydrolase/uridine kinase